MARGRAMSAGALVVAAVALAGCAPVERAAVAAPTPSPDSLPTAPTRATPLSVAIPEGETVLGDVVEMRGSAQAGPFENPTGRVALYVRCLGEGEVVVEIVGNASVEQPCQTDPEDQGTRNTLDVWATDEVVISGSAEMTARWAVAVTAIPNS
ncbi:hypothetical protein [Microbacterium sp. SA39]|uniref:hypothetical protein n=1 Tax=Microbacterium sp. SA39 TaxID=1263625 RepID=UPI0005F9E346|nr:hypothetical protein [Microbacterium sp. SA39]KJQ52508.1 hypothetical protein RS85_03398 [Microbacterium sp. SA39]